MYQTWMFQVAIFLFILTLIAIPFGEYMAKVFSNEQTFLSPILSPVEKFLYAIFKIDPSEDMDWKTFAKNLLIFNLVGLVFLFLFNKF